mgnify:CR=1 FL=1
MSKLREAIEEWYATPTEDTYHKFDVKTLDLLEESEDTILRLREIIEGVLEAIDDGEPVREYELREALEQS